MKKKTYIIIGMIIITIFFIITSIIIKNKKDYMKDNIKESTIENSVDDKENINNNTEEIEKIKKELNATADTSIYEIEEEPDGRRILQIKDEVQFKVDLAGIIKNGKPEEDDINSLINEKPKDTGVWISKQSRQKFLQLLKNNVLDNLNINNDGFLYFNTKKIEKPLEKEIQFMIESKKHYIINMTGVSYERDYISGEIVEYPFEDMDPVQIIEPYMFEDYIILEVTSNKNKKVLDKEIMNSIVMYK